MIHSTRAPSSTTRRWSSRRIWKDWTRPQTWSKRGRLRSRAEWRPSAQSGAGRRFAAERRPTQRWAAAVGAPDGSGWPSVPVARRRRIKQLGASDCQDHRRGPYWSLMRENAAIVRVYPRHVSERERPMTLMLLPDLPKGVRPLVKPIVDTADAAFVKSLDCQFLAWGSRA